MTEDNERSLTVRRTATLSAVVFLAIAAATGLVAYNFRGTHSTPRAVTVSDTTSAPDPASDSTIAADDTDTVDATGADEPGITADTTAVESSTTTVKPRIGTIPCPQLDGSSERVAAFDAAPPECIDPKATYSAVIETTEGTITISLDQRKAPKTVNNFVYLARYHFYDGLNFHRVIPGFVIQGGDPEGNGQGGPGYEFADGFPDRAGYAVGSVAMANSGPNTNGSQFFIVSGDLGLALPGQYTLFGKVTKGLANVTAIDKLGKQPAPDGTEYPPSRAVTITTLTIKAVGERESRIPGLSADTSIASSDSTAADTTAADSTAA